MIWRALLHVVVVCALLAGCTPSGEEDAQDSTSPDPAPSSATQPGAAPAASEPAAGSVPAITEAEAQKVLDKLNTRNNKANATLNSKLLKQVETESSFVIDNAIYRIGHKLDPDNKDPIKPFAWIDPVFHIPNVAEGTAPWYVAEVATDGNPDKRYAMVFTRKRDGKPWKVALYVSVGEGLPELATDTNGAAIAVPATGAPGLEAAPADAASAHATYLTEGGSSPDAARFASDERSQEIIDEVVDGTKLRETFDTVDSFEREVTVADYPVRALQTADGGAVAFYVTNQQLAVRRSDGVFTVQDQLAALGAKDVIVTPTGDQVLLVGMDIMWLDAWVAAVPAQGGGKISVLGNQDGMVKVAGADRSEYPSELPPELEALLPAET